MGDIQQTLAERQKTHGDFSVHADVTQKLKRVLQDPVQWHHRLTQSQREALDMIVHKIGRILSGNPDHVDHWHDIAGYATLVENQLKEGGK